MAPQLLATSGLVIPGAGCVVIADLARESLEVQMQAGELALEVLHQDVIPRVRAGVHICSMAPSSAPVFSDSGEVMRFGVWATPQREKLLGAFVLYDVEVERTTATTTYVRATPAPACRAPARDEQWQLCGKIMRCLIDTDLHATDGRLWRLIEWRFPRPALHHWAPRRAPHNIGHEMLDLVEGRDDPKLETHTRTYFRCGCTDRIRHRDAAALLEG